MTKTRQQAMILGVLVVVALVSWARTCARDQARQHARALATQAAVAAGPSLASRAVSHFEGWGRHPFALPVGGATSSVETGEFELAGIVWDPTAPYAIINGRVAQVGDRLGAYVVKQIKPDHVILSGDEGDRVLRVK